MALTSSVGKLSPAFDVDFEYEVYSRVQNGEV
jgi:hypothetical protein